MKPLNPPLDRSLPPPMLEPRPFRFPSCQHREFPGLRVTLAEVRRLPLVQLLLIVPAGAQFDPPGRAGLARLTCDLLLYGTVGQSGPLEAACSIERLGGRVSANADWDMGYLRTLLQSGKAREGIELLAEMAARPAFSEEQIFRLKRQYVAELAKLNQQPAFQAESRLMRMLYGQGVYGEPLVGSRQSLIRIQRQNILDFYSSYIEKGKWILVAAGDVFRSSLAADIESLMGRREAQWPAPPQFRPSELNETRICILDRPDAAQTVVRIGQAGIKRSHPDYLCATLMNTILGGRTDSRISLRLRELHGHTYSVRSRLGGRAGPGPFVVSTSVDTEKAGPAVSEVLTELRRIQQEPVSPQELRDSASYLSGVLPFSLQGVSGLAARLMEAALYDLPSDYFDTYAERLGAIDEQQIQRVAQQCLSPDRLAVVAVGPAQKLSPQLQKLGTVQVVEFEKEPPMRPPGLPGGGAGLRRFSPR